MVASKVRKFKNTLLANKWIVKGTIKYFRNYLQMSENENHHISVYGTLVKLGCGAISNYSVSLTSWLELS